MNKELETIIDNEFDCLINDLGGLMKQELVAEAIKEAVTKAFVLGSVIQQRKLLFAALNLAEELPMGLTSKERYKIVDKLIANNCG